MLISRTLEYAFRVAAVFAVAEPGGRYRARDLARIANVPGAYLSKILRQLVESGILRGERGHHGGFTLARPASKIFLIDICIAIEGAIEARRCVFGWDSCSSSRPCPLHGRWSELNETFQRWARKTSLAMLRNDVALQRPDQRAWTERLLKILAENS